MMNSINRSLEHWVTVCPDKMLYSFLDVTGEEVESYTFESFYHRTSVIASHLYSNHNFKKGERILLAYPAGIEMICAFIACSRLGLIPVPVYPPASNGSKGGFYKLSYIAEDCRATAIFTNANYFWSFRLNLAKNREGKISVKESYIANLQWINTEDFRDFNQIQFPEAHEDILFLQYTSGSTNDPKGVMVTHNNLIHNCNAVLDHAPVGVSWLPQYHDMGLIGYYLFMLIKGGTTYGFSSVDFIRRPALWLETITKYKGTASSAPNFAYDYCLQPGRIPEKTLENLDLSSLTILQNAAEPVRTDTYSRFLEFFKPYGLRPESFYVAFGLAENTLGVSSFGRTILSVNKNSLKMKKIELAPQDTDSRSTTQIMSCGTLLGDQMVKIVDPDTCTSLGDGCVGEVWVTGKSKCLGYWGKPELSATVFQANLNGMNGNSPTFLRTGDMGIIHQGELYICGRLKDMIIVRGLNYFPQDIEKITEEASEICRKGSVVAFDVEVDGNEKLVVVAGVRHFKTVPDTLKITDAIRSHIGIQPHAIAFIPARTIPKTSSGKVRRQMTKQLWLDGKLDVLHVYTDTKKSEVTPRGNDDISPFTKILDRYGLNGSETCSLANAGLDSIDLAVLLHDVKDLLERKGAHGLAKQIDLRLLQELSVSDFSEIAKQLKETSTATLMMLKKRFMTLQREHQAYEQSRMIADSKPIFKIDFACGQSVS